MDIYIRDADLKLINILDEFESIIWTDRYSKYGDFEIYTPATTEMFNKLKENYYLTINDSEHTMIIENIKLETDVEYGNHLTVTGRSLESILERRIIWNQTILNGNIQNCILKLLNENIIQPAIEERKIKNFIFEATDDEYINSISMSAQFTGDNLGEAIQSICNYASIGFKIILNSDNQFVFKLYNGVDRSYSQTSNPYVVFSPNFENIINSNYNETTEQFKNIALVAGEDQGSSRKTIVTGEDLNISDLNRRELFVDARDIQSETSDGSTIPESEYLAQLKSRGDEKLLDYIINKEFDGQIETSQMFIYGRDFFMGDITELENEYGLQTRVRVSEYIISEDQNGGSSYPTFTIID